MLIKYPRTFHFPWSSGTNDDKVLKDTSHFYGKQVVVTEKMDGECTTILQSTCHARSISSVYHPSQSYVKGLWGKIRYNIPDGERICGENLYARHTIPYDDLEDYFLGFSYWRNEICFDWENTLHIFETLGIKHVPIIYEGEYNEDFLQHLKLRDTQEGYVVRLSSSFNYNDFGLSIAKYVSPKFVIPNKHWKFEKIVPNNLKGQ